MKPMEIAKLPLRAVGYFGALDVMQAGIERERALHRVLPDAPDPRGTLDLNPLPAEAPTGKVAEIYANRLGTVAAVAGSILLRCTGVDGAYRLARYAYNKNKGDQNTTSR